ncbi:hypothetical protein Y032_0069g363 [Ancylostoma ceylanicum]|uniref:LIM zinc-binding domain-containing protein n=1 Tax=Ancylostoma ceylanicum TaxID=53326 RepID=A0A016TY63_9BILA|nr:hypothetical protein Y032_0069g363 [Ancylostoma ceylanicum]
MKFRSDVCAVCDSDITQESIGCRAMGQTFHVKCFKCSRCNKKLAGFSTFYRDGDKPICEVCYQDTLDKCKRCRKPITGRMLRADGCTFHDKCCVCANCQKSLEGAPYTKDPDGFLHCMPCFHERFAPQCAACKGYITPEEGSNERVWIQALDQNYHKDCFKCESCGLKLSSKVKGAGCVPFNLYLYCQSCHLTQSYFGSDSCT